MAKDKDTQIDNLVAEVDKKIQDSNEWPFRRQMMINTSYYNDNQWIGWNDNARTVIEAPKQQGEERITHNVIKPRVLTKLAKQTKNRLKYDVAPDTNEEERIEAAKGATKYVRFWWEDQQMDLKTRDIFLIDNVKGYCAAKTVFDPSQGDDITPDEEEALKLGIEDVKQTRTGKVTCRICDPLTLHIDPAATTEEEIRWIIEEKPRDVDYIKEEYDVDVLPDPNLTYATNYDVSSSNMRQAQNQNMAMVREMWVKPCKKYPKGLKVTCTKDKLLDKDENAGDLPYTIFGDIPIPGNVRYDAFIKSMLPIQRNLNIALTMFAINMKRMGNNVWFIPTGSGVDEEELSNEISQFIHYNASAGAAPNRAEAPNMPNFFDRLIEHYNGLIDDMSGAREISQQRLPAGLDTASGLELMVEQENEKLAVPMNNYEQGMKKVLNRVLKLMQKHYSEERLGRIVGEDGEVETIAFTGTDLTGGEDINIVQGSSLPEMKSAQQDRIMSLWGAGAIVKKDGTPDPDTLLRMLGMGDSTALFDQHMLDENKAKMENNFFSEMVKKPENFQMYAGYMQQKQQIDQHNQQLQAQAQQQGQDPSMVQMIPPTPPPKGIPFVRDFQDHEIHLYNHNSFRKSKDYDELPPEMQQMVDAHVAEHEAMVGQAVDPQAQSMQQDAQNQAQQLQLQQSKQETDAQLAQAKIDAEAQRNQSQVSLAELKAQVDLIKQEMQHQHESTMTQLSHGQQMQRDKQNNNQVKEE
jgi:hypothetical protein